MTVIMGSGFDTSAGGSAARMRAHAKLGTELRSAADGPRTYVTTLRSEPPLSLRQTIAIGSEPSSCAIAGVARVSITASAAGPVGGDHYQLDIHIGTGSALVLSEVSATVLLPSHDRAVSRTTISVKVDPAGTLIWLPAPVIAAHRCDHIGRVQIDLAADARLLMREEFILGRHQEPSGRLRQRVRIRQDGRPLFSQDFEVGSAAWTSPGVGSDYRAFGSVLVVDPGWKDIARRPLGLTGQTAVLPLAGSAVLISALAHDSLALSHQLEMGLAAIGPFWQPRS